VVTEIVPPARLRPWVEAYWTRPASAGEIDERVLPDGCADIVFSLDRGTAMTVGTMTRPLVLRGGTPSYFGVRFRPGRAGAFLRFPLDAITDGSADLDDAALAERVAEARTQSARMDAIEAWLVRRAAEPDPRVDHAVALLAAGRAVDEVAREVNLSRQHLRRRFLRHVGVGPKTFARVTRFQRLLAHVRRDASLSWAAAAADTGYFDQSHLIADFRDFAGTTPVPFFLSP
jgi:AraC-like DNA-binding protein